MTFDYDPSQRAGHTESWPCGCTVEDEWGHLHPCAKHEHITNEAMLWETLKDEYPDPLDDGARDAMQVYDPNEDGA